MAIINIVYAHTRRNGHAEHKDDHSIILSTHPVVDCDMYVYQDAFSFYGELPGVEILLMLEPYVVLPGEYSDEIWHYFDYVLTFADEIAEQRGKFRKIKFPVFPIYDDQGDGTRVENPHITCPLSERKHAVCMINGNKHSFVEGELYSKRVEIARWFHEFSEIPFHAFGYPPYELPNYRGRVENKFQTLAQYKYCLCFENVHHPIWSRGYISEKLLHCLLTETVPIYLGCYNIEDYVPTGCFIDFRQFRNYGELNDFLNGLSENEYLAYVDNIRTWVRAGHLNEYSSDRLYDQLVSLLQPAHAESAGRPWEPGPALHHQRREYSLYNSDPMWTWQELANQSEIVQQRTAHIHHSPGSIGSIERHQ